MKGHLYVDSLFVAPSAYLGIGSLWLSFASEIWPQMAWTPWLTEGQKRRQVTMPGLLYIIQEISGIWHWT